MQGERVLLRPLQILLEVSALFFSRRHGFQERRTVEEARDIHFLCFSCVASVLLVEELQRVQRQLTTWRQRKHRTFDRHGSTRITKRMQTVAVTIYTISESADAAANYLLRYLGRRIDRPAELVETWLLQMDLTVIQECAYAPSTARQQRIRDFADRFLAERTAAQWLYRRISEQGRVVAADELVQRYLAALWKQDVSLDEEGIYTRRHSTQVNARMRKWCTRFKARWDLKTGTLPHRDPLPVQEVRERVPG